jgi:hypothetical protein
MRFLTLGFFINQPHLGVNVSAEIEHFLLDFSFKRKYGLANMKPIRDGSNPLVRGRGRID